MARIAVIGGTGSFGQAFVKRYLNEHEITVISRDELKQHEMRLEFPDVTYKIGDVRDRGRMGEVLKGFDFVFHAAALKQVPSCEFFPEEAVKTNILGTMHVLDAAQGAKVICLSTDKAVYPINAMGTSKAMMEKVAISKGAVVTRYGNVMRSRGSIIPIWEEAAKEGKPLTLTNPDMTRFLMSLDDSIDLVMYAMEHGEPGEIFVKKAPACRMQTLAKAISDDIKEIGIRHGEKMHESLISQEEMQRTVDEGGYFRVRPDSRDMNYSQYFSEGNSKDVEAYTSENTTRLNTEEVKDLLCTLKC
jgi:UDP-N-acetylglucosamine 4,6-dehydratase/5-epimerase